MFRRRRSSNLLSTVVRPIPLAGRVETRRRLTDRSGRPHASVRPRCPFISAPLIEAETADYIVLAARTPQAPLQSGGLRVGRVRHANVIRRMGGQCFAVGVVDEQGLFFRIVGHLGPRWSPSPASVQSFLPLRAALWFATHHRPAAAKYFLVSGNSAPSGSSCVWEVNAPKSRICGCGAAASYNDWSSSPTTKRCGAIPKGSA